MLLILYRFPDAHKGANGTAKKGKQCHRSIPAVIYLLFVLGSKSAAAGSTPLRVKNTVYAPGNIPTTKKERAAAALIKKKIAAAAAAAQAAAAANHCYYANCNSTGSSNVSNNYGNYSNNSNSNNSNQNTNNIEEMSPGFSGMGNSTKGNNGENKEGRPSIGTITEQWEFMRINFVNNSDEVLYSFIK